MLWTTKQIGTFHKLSIKSIVKMFVNYFRQQNCNPLASIFCSLIENSLLPLLMMMRKTFSIETSKKYNKLISCLFLVYEITCIYKSAIVRSAEQKKWKILFMKVGKDQRDELWLRFLVGRNQKTNRTFSSYKILAIHQTKAFHCARRSRNGKIYKFDIMGNFLWEKFHKKIIIWIKRIQSLILVIKIPGFIIISSKFLPKKTPER